MPNTRHRQTPRGLRRATPRALRALTVLILVALPIGCASPRAGGGGDGDARGEQPTVATPTALDGRWTIATVKVGDERSQVPAGAASDVHLTFTRGSGAVMELNGHGGVNRIFATVQVGTDGTFGIDGIGSTRMAGPPAMMAFESRLLAALRNVDRWRGEDTGVILSGPDTKIWLLPDARR